MFDSVIKIRVTGRNIDNYLKKIIKDKISILDLEYLSYREIILVVYYKDYLKLLKKKTIYEITVVERMGFLRIKDSLKRNRYVLLFLLLGVGLLYFLANIIFDVEIVHSKSEIRNLVREELNNYGISKYKFKKSHKELEKIEDKILENNKDTLDWLEIIVTGTKYTVKVQERVLNEEKEQEKFRDIIATKNAVLTKIIATKGEKVKTINTLVHKGDVVISGVLSHSNGEVSYTNATGEIYGEVWYNVSVEFPYIYSSYEKTKRVSDVYVLNVGNHKIKLWGKNNFKDYVSDNKTLLFNNYIPISIVLEKREEVIVKETIYTEDEAVSEALKLVEKGMKDKNDKIEGVKEIKILNKEFGGNTVKLKLFVSVNENITGKQEIREEDLIKEKEAS